jgi:glycosyltransferase involved in cell wall biosynthesis
MDVCLVSDLWSRPNPTGIGVYMQRVLERVPAAAPDSSFTALAFRESEVPRVPTGPNLRYAQVPGNTKLAWAKWLLRGATKDVERRAGGASVTHALHPMPASTSSGPWISTVHDLTPIMFPEMYAPRERFKFTRSMNAVARRGAHVIAISQVTADDVRRIYDLPESRISVVRYGIDAERVELTDAMREDLVARYRLPRRFGLFVGELNRRKNLVVLVQAFAKIAGQVPDVDLVLAGSDGLGADELRDTIAAERLGDRVHLPGYVGHGDTLGLMAMSEVFAFPSKYEGFGLPPLEAMVQGTPVVTAAGGSLPEIVGDAALVSDPSDVEGIAANLLQVLTEPDVRDRLVARGLARAAEFSWERMALETCAVYEQLTA